MKTIKTIAIVLGLTAQCAMGAEATPTKGERPADQVITYIPSEDDSVENAPTKPERPALKSTTFIPGEAVVTSLF